MPAPSTYTEAEIAAFMVTALGEVATALEWTGLAHVHEAVNETLLAYGASTIDDATDIPKLRALSRREAWRAAVASLVARYDFSNPEGSYSRSQMLRGAREALADAESAALPYDTVVGTAYVSRVSHIHDPYVPLAEEARVLS